MDVPRAQLLALLPKNELDEDLAVGFRERDEREPRPESPLGYVVGACARAIDPREHAERQRREERQPELEVDGRVLPRGDVLLMGGDQVYPVANGDGYENRMKGPYRAALPEAPEPMKRCCARLKPSTRASAKASQSHGSGRPARPVPSSVMSRRKRSR